MLSQSQVKHITALKVKKFREERIQFVAEGHKLVLDLVNSEFKIAGIYACADWIVDNISQLREKNIPVFEALPREMDRISGLATPARVLAVVDIPEPATHDPVAGIPDPASNIILALDDIRDPGNLGTIIRIADWFGIYTILCSETCVDTYNPKVVQSSMGSIARVNTISCDLAVTIASLMKSSTSEPSSGLVVYGTFLEGKPIFSQVLSDHGIIVIGNESRGISPALLPYITHKLFIPSFGSSFRGKAESLNAAIAAAVICAEFRRNEN